MSDHREIDDKNDKSIMVPGYGRLMHLEKDPKCYYRRTTLFYGVSDTGKSTLMMQILHALRPYIPNVIVINPTNTSNGTFDGVVPPDCIKSKADIQMLKDILARQKDAVETYNKVNNIKLLAKLFARANDLSARTLVTRLQKLVGATLQELESSDLDFAQKKAQMDSIKEKHEKNLRQIYRKTIDFYKDSLQRMNLTSEERFALKYMHINPNLLLIMDDCASQIKEWGKDESIKEIFYAGRWWWITMMITMQHDKLLTSDIRKSTFNNFFTESNSAVGFFENKANAFTKPIKKAADTLSEFLFKPNDNGTKNYKKLVHSRLDPVNPFRYVIADILPPFRFGSKALWDLCDKIPKDSNAKSTSKFAGSFSL